MNAETYYRDHWLEIEPERVAAYELMFEWRPAQAPLLEGAELVAGQTVVDFGCGPGGLAVELARRVSPGGQVIAVDLNAELIERGRARAARDGVADAIEWHHATDDRIPIKDGSVDCVICKNVLEYVPGVGAALREMGRVLRPGGRVHVIDSDWGMLVVEPLGEARLRDLFEAARVAYRTPLIGRRLYGELRAAGFDDVRVRGLLPIDTQGYMAPIVHNMIRYARSGGALDAAAADALGREIEGAIAGETWLAILPQFIATGLRG